MLWPNGERERPPISSGFGPRKAPVAGASTFHRGTDFIGYSRIHAIAAGRVVAVGTPSGWAGGGVQVWIQHDGFLSRSMHMAKGSPTVRVGQDIGEGHDLGAMGNTGNVSGVHHHLEIVVDGVQVDPVPFITNHLAAVSGGMTTPPEGLFMYLTKMQEETIHNAVVDINNRTFDMAAAMAKADAQVAALHAMYVERDANGWTFANIVQSHVVATLAELRAAGVATGRVDVDALAQRVVDETARRLTD